MQMIMQISPEGGVGFLVPKGEGEECPWPLGTHTPLPPHVNGTELPRGPPDSRFLSRSALNVKCLLPSAASGDPA